MVNSLSPKADGQSLMAAVSVKGVFAQEAVAEEVGDGVGVAGEFFRGEDEEFCFGHHAAVPGAVQVVGDVKQIDSEFVTVFVTEFAGFDFEQEVLNGLGGFVEFVVDVGGVQRESGAEGEFAEGAVAKEVGRGVAMVFEFFLSLSGDFFVGKVTTVPGAVEVVGDVIEMDSEFRAVVGAEFTGGEFADEFLQVEVGFGEIELEILEVHGITRFGVSFL